MFRALVWNVESVSTRSQELFFPLLDCNKLESLMLLLYCVTGVDNEKALMSQIKFEKKFGQSPVFIASTLMEEGGVPRGASSASLLKEAIHVISCGYEDKTEWGKEVFGHC